MFTDVGLALVQVAALVAGIFLGLYALSKLESSLDSQEPTRVLVVRLALVLLFVAVVVAEYRRMGF